MSRKSGKPKETPTNNVPTIVRLQLLHGQSTALRANEGDENEGGYDNIQTEEALIRLENNSCTNSRTLKPCSKTHGTN